MIKCQKMRIKLKKKEIGFLFLILFYVFSLITGISITTNSVLGSNISNVTLFAKVNISNAQPTLYEVRIEDPIDINNRIDLSAGNSTTITCNGTFQDGDGYDDIAIVNATLYYTNGPSGNVDDNNTFYTNTSCGTCQVIPGSSNLNGTCLCKFAVQYYANSGNWRCNMTVTDSWGVESSQNSSDDYYINEVLGIGVENLTLDYGAVSVLQVSSEIRNNITNLGNVPINITLRGYAGVNETEGINYTMFCAEGNNITFGYQRYSLYENQAFIDMINLTNQTRPIEDLTVPQRTTEGTYGNSTNSTFWRLEIPIGSAGVCNGTIIFGAIDATES